MTAALIAVHRALTVAVWEWVVAAVDDHAGRATPTLRWYRHWAPREATS